MKYLVKSLKILALFTGVLFFNSCQKAELPVPPISTPSTTTPVVLEPWKMYRGINISPNISRTDLEDLAVYHPNVVRINFSANPLVRKTSPYSFNEDAFAKLDFVINECERLNMKVIIDPHTSPGFASNFSTTAKDVFWTDTTWHAHLTKVWVRIAQTYKNRGNIIAGYDLMNEPTARDGFPNTPEASWNQIFSKLITKIRAEGDNHTIIIATQQGVGPNGTFLNWTDGINQIVLPSDTNIVLSPHMYTPTGFTHQGVTKPISGPYPGTFNNTYWNKATLDSRLKVLVDYRAAHPDVPIYIGEFSASRYCGPSGDQYVADLIDLFEKYGFSWSYHSYRQAADWDAELSNTDLSNNVRSSTTPRVQLLTTYFKK
ncbi:glycoside hydrolase family 5 protein [Hymenobacter sp.]|uniref:glycoside hydrolase family 5 protein n=1 Tax=Hymenobacter sp. TaxID=1898978 RepID=UPI00286B8D97|nr:glycoside hydrolase family 5 protein [Hymenobacter sp.]